MWYAGRPKREDLERWPRAWAEGVGAKCLELPKTAPAPMSGVRLQRKLELAAGRSLVNYGFYIGATPNNLDELKAARRTPGIKIFIGSSTGDLLVDDQEALERIFAETSLPIAAHCEDETTVRANTQRWSDSTDVADHSRIRDERAAMIATRRAVDLAIRHQHRFHVLHVSTGAEVALFAEHHNLITAEVCPHHLFFNVDDYATLGSLIQMNPSIKTAADNERLWQARLEGQVQVIATDHAPHTLEEKQRPYPRSPSGIPAVENSLALMLNQVALGRCRIEQVVRWMCEAPALVWDIVNKGRIARGFDADLVLVDLERQFEIRNEQQETKCRWSPWHGTTGQGLPVRTWVMGHELFCENRFDESRKGHEVQFDHSRPGYWHGQRE